MVTNISIFQLKMSAPDLLSESLEKPLHMKEKHKEEEKEILIEELIEQGERGNTVAQFSLAKIYMNQKEMGKAMHYLTSAASKGDIQAMYQLAIMKYEGLDGREPSPVSHYDTNDIIYDKFSTELRSLHYL